LYLQCAVYKTDRYYSSIKNVVDQNIDFFKRIVVLSKILVVLNISTSFADQY